MPVVYSNNLCSAYLTEIVRAFSKYHPGSFLGRTAMQKLAYFSKVTGVPLPCSFEIYNYGPYSDRLTFAVDSMLADEILVDNSPDTSRYSSYTLASGNLELPEALEKQVRSHRPQINRVVQALGGFRPEQLELIATLHFVASRKKTMTAKNPTKGEVVREFLKIKGEKFARQEVDSWYEALERAKLI